MATRDIIVIGASAGGVEALSQLVATLRRDLPAAVFVTVHFPRTIPSVLPKILDRAGTLSALHPVDGETIRSGRIYVAPPDFHLLLSGNVIRLVRGPTENGNRPAIDPMFRSAAVTYGPRVIGIVLTGSLDDGTAGLMAITRRGGIGIAQDPDEATFSSMPASAIANGAVHHTVPVAGMAPLLHRLTRETVDLPPGDPVSDEARREHAFDLGTIEDSVNHPGDPSPYPCPDCSGVLWELEEGDMLRFRCRVGHGWTNDGLLMQQTETLDTALCMALRALEESAGLNTRLARRAEVRGDANLYARLSDQAEAAERRARVIREALSRPNALSGSGPATGTHG